MSGEHHFERAALVVNTASRAGASAYAAARERLRELGIPLADFYPVTDAARLPEVFHHVATDGNDLVIVGGGDGSLSTAVDFLADHHVTLGVLPLGTANDFARTLHIPRDVGAACDTIAHGKVVDIDLGQVGDNQFVNVAQVGLAVGVTEALSPRLKRWLGPLAYPLAAGVAYRRHQAFTAWLDFPDDDHEPLKLDDLLQVAIGNGRYYGGGYAVSPTAGIDDHTLDVYAIPVGRLRDHLDIARFLRDGSFVKHRDVVHLTTRRMRLRTEPEQRINVDGEVVAATPQEFAVRRNAIDVLIPQHSTAARQDRGGRDRRWRIPSRHASRLRPPQR
jgi:YegS/Rv2252/BmrU family lipid kinase